MSEKVTMRQEKGARPQLFINVDDNASGSGSKQAVNFDCLNPYQLLLASLGSSTIEVMRRFAGQEGLPLREIELRLSYGRDFNEDCRRCGSIAMYPESIKVEVILAGDLEMEEHERLFLIARECPIYRILESRVVVNAGLLSDRVVA